MTWKTHKGNTTETTVR